MSNIKLKDHNWATDGIYDTQQEATQKALNTELVERGRNVIKVQDTQPASTYNQIWLPETVGEGVQVPTWAEHQALESSLNGAIKLCPSTDANVATTIPNGTDYDTLTTPGDYGCWTASAAQTMTNAPTSQGHRLYVVQNVASNRLTQIALPNTDTAKLLLRTLTSSGWSSWTEPSYRVQSQIITNIERDYTATKSYSVGDFLAINANLYKVTSAIANGNTISASTNTTSTTVASELKSLNSFAAGLSGLKAASFALNSSSSKTFTIPNTSYGLLFSFGSLTTIQEIAVYRTTSSGTVRISQVFNATNLVITTTTNKISVENTSTNATQIVFLSFSGDTITQG